MKSDFKLIILDFDGTFTDLAGEGLAFKVQYIEKLAKELGYDISEIAALEQQFRQQIFEHPENFGWKYQEKIIGPATGPHVSMSLIAEMILDHYHFTKDAAPRAYLLGKVYRASYETTAVSPVFKKDAWLVLRTLCRLQELGHLLCYVVTNSGTEAVKKKLRILEEREGKVGSLNGLIENVIGQAQKNVLGDQPANIPESVLMAGLKRPVYLRRTIYFSVIDELRMREGTAWKNVLVFGDNYELDLAMPGALGAKVYLVANPCTPAYECQHCGVEPGTDAELIQSVLGPIFQ